MYAVIYIPDFCLQAVLRHEPELPAQPIALIDASSSKPEIIACNSAAQRCGVSAGLTPSQALARCAPLNIKRRAPACETSTTEILLQTACSFSPNIEATAPGVCTMDLKGLGLDSPAALPTRMEQMAQALAQFHLDAKIGVAPTPALALLAARAARPIAIVRDPGDFIAPLPLTALEPSPPILDLLNRWGIRDIGGLLALGRDSVAARLGPEAVALFDRVPPEAVRPLQIVCPPQEFSEQMEFENEIETAAPLLFVLRRFVEQLSHRLETVYFVVGEFQLRLGLASGAAHERVFKIPSPTGKIETLFRVLQTHLETVRTDSPIISIRLAAQQAVPEHQQFGLFESALRDPNQFAETLARLSALLGPDNAGTPVLHSTHKPDSFSMRPPEFNQPPAPALERLRADIQKAGLRLRRLRPPARAHFEFRGERPALIRSDLFNGPITGARGPFFNSGQWWDEARWTREEWDVATVDGSFLRIFRSGDGCFVEGVYD